MKGRISCGKVAFFYNNSIKSTLTARPSLTQTEMTCAQLCELRSDGKFLFWFTFWNNCGGASTRPSIFFETSEMWTDSKRRHWGENASTMRSRELLHGDRRRWRNKNGSSLPSGSAADTQTCVCLTAAARWEEVLTRQAVSTNRWSQKLGRRVKSTDVGKLSGTWEFTRVAQPVLMSSCCRGLVDQFENSSDKMLYFYVYMNRGSTGGKSAEARNCSVSWFYSWRHRRQEEDASLRKTGMDIESFGLPGRLQLTDWQLVASPR